VLGLSYCRSQVFASEYAAARVHDVSGRSGYVADRRPRAGSGEDRADWISGPRPRVCVVREIDALRAGLRELGYAEGKNIVLDFRWAANVGEMSRLANEFVGMNVDIIFAPASTQVAPAREATKTIQIVFAQHAKPVGTGHVASLSHPGGNITGVSMVLTELAAKGLEILKQAVPNASRFGILWNPTTPSHAKVVEEIEVAGKTLGVQLLMTPVRTVETSMLPFQQWRGSRLKAFSFRRRHSPIRSPFP
jgi:hypothetical protein